MKQAVRAFVFLSSFLLAFGAFAAGTATITGGTLMVDIDEGSDLNFSEVTGYTDALAALTGNTVTELVKTGNGRVCVSDDISAFTGILRVTAGVYAYTSKESLGADATGADVYVSSGATLEASPAKEFSGYFKNKATHFSGTGAVVDGESLGALLKSGNECWHGPFGKYLIMDDDALVRTKNTVAVYFTSAELQMNGHDLTYITYSATTLAIWTSVKIVDPGNIYVGDSTHSSTFLWDQSMSGANGEGQTLNLHKGSTLTLRNDTTKEVFPKWTLKLLGNATLKADSGRQTDAWLMDTNRYCYAGPIDLGDYTLTLNSTYTPSSQRNRQLTVAGVISGAGGLKISPGNATADSPRGYTHLQAENTFEGGMTIQNSEVYLWKAGAIPNAGEVKATDSSLTFNTGADDQTIPKTTFDGTTEMSVTDGRGTLTELVKKGEGTLTYASSMALPKVDVQAGTLKFAWGACPTTLTPGWIGGRKTFDDNASAQAVYKSRELLTNLVENTSGPFDKNGYESIIWKDEYGGVIKEPGASTSRASAVVYSGYVNNDLDTDAVWAFMVGSWGSISLYVDDDETPIINTDKSIRRGTRTMSPGLHRIEIRGYRSANASGRIEPMQIVGFLKQYPTDGWTSSTPSSKNGLGVRVCKTNPDSMNLDDYGNLTDSGDGSKISWNNPTLDPFPVHPITGEQLREPLAVGDVTVADGATLDSSMPKALSVKTLTGGTSVAGAAGLVVREQWNVTGSAVGTAAGKLAVTGPLTFDDGAKIVVSGKPAAKSGVEVEILSADSITGEPELEVPASEGWTLSKSQDGKKLLISRPPTGTTISFK